MLRILMPFTLCLLFSNPLIAQDDLTDRQRVEEMVRMNSNGLVSFTYEVKWPHEKAAYGQSLFNVLKSDLLQVDAECRAIKKSMNEDADLILSPDFFNVIRSLHHEDEIHHILLMNSVIKQYVGKYPVDIETTEDQGEYDSIRTAECTNDNVENFGMIQHMFPRFQGAFDREVKVGTCSRIKKASMCLRDIFTITLSRVKSAKTVVEWKSPALLQDALLVP